VEGIGNEVRNKDLFQLPVTTGYIWRCRKLGRVRDVMGLMVIPLAGRRNGSTCRISPGMI